MCDKVFMSVNHPTRGSAHSSALRAPGAFAVALAGLALTGCNGAFWGNLAVLGVTVGIFFGTLALGRSTAAAGSAEASTSTQSSGRR